VEAEVGSKSSVTGSGADGGFQQINFGFADAHTEGAEAPELLRDGFLDEGMVATALAERSCVFLGYKGSGKTAIAERARLLAENNPGLFIKVATLDEFPYSDFKSAAGTGEPQTMYPTVWMWLLLVALFESLENDESGKEKAASEYRLAVGGLKQLGLIPTPELNFLVVRSSKKSFKLRLPKVLDFGSERALEAQDLQLSQAVTTLKRAASRFPTENRHVLFLDGLDEILGQRDLQFQALAALMVAATRLNNRFREDQKPFKVVILCRTDIFDRLSGANVNKIRADYAESLHWYDDPAHPDQTRLVRLVNLRAERSLNRKVNVFSEFFPPDINGRDTRKEVLDHTRHTPRDLIQVFGYLQEFARDAPVLSPKQVRAGLRAYSIEYFLPEIRNEMHGYLHSTDIQRAEQILREHGSQYFTLSDLEATQTRLGRSDSVNMKLISEVLFDCSALGFIEKRHRTPLRTMKYRNPHAQLMPGKTMWLHPAACRALDIQPGPPVANTSRSTAAKKRRRGRRGGQGRR